MNAYDNTYSFFSNLEWFEKANSSILERSNLKRVGIRVPDKARYFVFLTESKSISIWNENLKSYRYYSPSNFVSGQTKYEQSTEHYPNYVHDIVWHLVKYSRNK